MKDLIIFGITPFSKLIKDTILSDQGRKAVAFCVSEAYLPSPKEFDGIPIVAFEKLHQIYEKENFEVLITIGYTRMNKNRKSIFDACDKYGYSIASYIHSTARCNQVDFGRGNIVLQDCILHRYTTIGEGNIFIDNTTIGHESTIGNFNFFAGMTTGGLVTVHDYCFLGMRSIVCQGCTLGTRTLLGAGTVLAKDSEPDTVIMPAANRTAKMTETTIETLLH